MPARPGGAEWQFVAETLSAEDRWALVVDYPTDQGWRFATLEDLGQHAPENTPLRAASSLLAGSRALRSPADLQHGVDPRDRLAAAVRLGADWRGLKLDAAWQRADPLVFAKPKRLPRRKIPE